MEGKSILFDKELREAVEDIAICGGPLFGDLQWNWLVYPLGLVVVFVLGSALDGLHGTISYFDFKSFTSKDIVPPKAQHVLASFIFSKPVQDMDIVEAKIFLMNVLMIPNLVE